MTRLAPLDVKSSGSEGFGLANYNKLKGDIEYLTIAGADLASAATINPTAEFHAVTGTTTIDNIVDPVGAVAGQQVRLWIKNGPLTIRNNGGGTGNIRTNTGKDISLAANAVVSFVYDGTAWRELKSYAPGDELSYQEFTANVSVTATSEASANAIVTAAALTLDGSTPVDIDFYCPSSSSSLTNASGNWIALHDGTSFTGRQELVLPMTNGGTVYGPGAIRFSRKFTPSAGSKTFSIRGYVAAGTLTIQAGPGGAATLMPGFIRIRRA